MVCCFSKLFTTWSCKRSDVSAVPIVTYSDSVVTYNSFASLQEADSYHKRSTNGKHWREIADNDNKEIALFHATDVLNRQKWKGTPTRFDQTLVFPRRYLEDRLAYHKNKSTENYEFSVAYSNAWFDKDTIPQPIVDATSELANYLLLRESSGFTTVSKYTDQLSDIKLGKIGIKLRQNSDYFTDLPQEVVFMVKEFLAEPAESDMGNVVSLDIEVV